MELSIIQFAPSLCTLYLSPSLEPVNYNARMLKRNPRNVKTKINRVSTAFSTP
jgi:hypothetical protein